MTADNNIITDQNAAYFLTFTVCKANEGLVRRLPGIHKEQI